MVQLPDDSGWRGSKDGWLDAAYDSLLESGVDSVKILPLAKRLSLSRTSFYWFFKDRETLLADLLGKWRDKNTGNLVRQCDAYAESLVEATLNVFDCWLDPSIFDAQFEFAVRSWALQSPDVALEVEAADARRIEALTSLFSRFGFDDIAADVRARTMYLTQIGYISMRSKDDLPTRMSRIPEYVTIFTGKTAGKSDLDRFHARHGFRAV